MFNKTNNFLVTNLLKAFIYVYLHTFTDVINFSTNHTGC